MVHLASLKIGVRLNSKGIENYREDWRCRHHVDIWARGYILGQMRRVIDHIERHPKDKQAKERLYYLASEAYFEDLTSRVYDNLVERRAKQLIILGWTPEYKPRAWSRRTPSVLPRVKELYEEGYRGLTLEQVRDNFSWLSHWGIKARLDEARDALIFYAGGQDLASITKDPSEVRPEMELLVDPDEMHKDHELFISWALKLYYWKLGHDCSPRTAKGLEGDFELKSADALPLNLRFSCE